MVSRACVVVSIVLLAACGEKAPAPATSAPVVPASVSAAQFQSLGWIAGKWRGAEAGGAPFFESYATRDSVTIASYAHADSTFSAPADSGALTLRGDTLFSGSPAMQWVATSIDSMRVVFAPWRGANNGFTWERTGPSTWTATLAWDSAGTPKQKVYLMQAVTPTP